MNIVLGATYYLQDGVAYSQNNISDPVATIGWDIRTGPNPNPQQALMSANWSSAYLQADYKILDPLKLVAGSQLNMIPGFSANFSPRVGAILNFENGIGGKLLLSNAFRAPAGIERSAWNSVTISSNPNLTPEKVQTLEGQISYSQKILSLSGTAFYSNYTDLISRTGTSVLGGPMYLNSGTLEAYGLELEGKTKLTDNILSSSNLSWSRTRDASGFMDISGTPPLMIKTGLSYTKPKDFSLGLFASYISQAIMVPTPKTVYSNPAVTDYLDLSLNSKYDITRVFTQWMGVKAFSSAAINLYAVNLLDASINYPEYNRKLVNSIQGRSGRSFYLGLTAQF